MKKRTSLANAFTRHSQVYDLDLENLTDTARPRRTLPVDLDTITIENRIRPSLDHDKIDALAHSMEVNGLQSPILIRPACQPDPAHPHHWGPETPGRFALVAGAHRIAAARLLGWPTIEAMVVNADPEECQLIEIDENLARTENTPLDRARFLAARKRVHHRVNAGSGRGGDRKSDAFHTASDRATSYATDSARDIGLAPRTIRRAIVIGEALGADDARVLATTPLAHRETDLHRLARLAPRERRRVIAAIRKATPPPRTLAEILPPERRIKETHDDQADLGLRSAWEHTDLVKKWRLASPSARSAFIAWIRAQR